MSVIVDEKPLATGNLGLQTVGQLLSHLRRDNRLVVSLLIDGQQPDLAQIQNLRKSPLQGRTVFIETTNAREMAIDVLDEIQNSLTNADQSQSEAIDLLQLDQVPQAMEKLTQCFTAWQAAQESVLKISQLLQIDLNKMDIDGQTIPAFLDEFTAQLRQIKDALSNRDYVLLADMLRYETTQSSERWQAVIAAMREMASS